MRGPTAAMKPCRGPVQNSTAVAEVKARMSQDSGKGALVASKASNGHTTGWNPAAPRPWISEAFRPSARVTSTRLLRYCGAMWLLLLSCTNAERYTDDQAEARCSTYARCDVLGVLGFDDEDQCVELRAGLEVPECELDRQAARDCVAGWEDLACDDLAAPPEVCETVCVATEDSGDSSAEE